MPSFKFDNFVFDSTNYRLTHNRDAVPLRPKALQLLNLLLQNRERVVTKSEIFLAIWHSEYVRDHLLFQLISELRKAPFDPNFVRTVPNRGYQWNVATKIAKKKMPVNIAASLLVGSATIASLLFWTAGDKPTMELTQLPAHSAFSKGVIAMHSGEHDHAERWFRFSLSENPESVESSLFLAETLFHQNKEEESLQTLRALLRQPNLASYNKMTATDLLSRIHQRQGRLRDALHFAQQSSQTNVIAQCSVDAVEGRIEMLERIIKKPAIPFELAQQSTPIRNEGSQPRPENASENSNIKTQPNIDCEQLNIKTGDTSYCEPNIDTELFVYQWFPNNRETHTTS